MAKQADFDHTGTVPVALAPEERERIGGEIERLIALLDAADVDPDLEDNGDGEEEPDGEPSLGWPQSTNQDRAQRLGPTHAGDIDLEDDQADLEHSLGSLGGTWNAESFSQEHWARGAASDLEEEHDGREPDVDDEPSLSLANDINQARALRNESNGFRSIITDGEGPDADREPSLGSLHGGTLPEHFDQADWAQGWHCDLEQQCEDEGADADALGLAT